MRTSQDNQMRMNKEKRKLRTIQDNTQKMVMRVIQDNWTRKSQDDQMKDGNEGESGQLDDDN
eukprot:52346-Ditylum_brightwellii.AAC.1